MPTYLDDIVAAHRAMAAKDERPMAELARAADRAAPVRGFGSSLRTQARRGVAVAAIAEIKRRSPSAGALAPGLDPADLARLYEKGGATCLSVLTDGPHFGGAAEDLIAARDAVSLPVLRKDFTVCERDVLDARAMGADALLLIVAALDEEELACLLRLAGDVGLDALVEVHDHDELDRALSAGAQLIGVNQRDLRTFSVDAARAASLAPEIPAQCLRVAESGIKHAAQAQELARCGYDAILVGEAFVTAPDPVAALQAFTSAAA